jgi:hypothetical protein
MYLLTYLLSQPKCLPETGIFSVQIFVQVKPASFDVWTDRRTSEYRIGLTPKDPNSVGKTSTILALNSELNHNYSSIELRTEPQLF